MNKEQIQSLPSENLWAIVRSTNSMTEKFANELTWAKEELTRRGELRGEIRCYPVK